MTTHVPPVEPDRITAWDSLSDWSGQRRRSSKCTQSAPAMMRCAKLTSLGKLCVCSGGLWCKEISCEP
eukprot:1159201-Pelagomonas_calceolata.AAC.6